MLVNERFTTGKHSPSVRAPQRHIGFDDETLRDGLQSPSVREPTVEKKIELLHLMNALSIDTADIGLPGAGGTHAAGVERLAREIADQKLKIRPNCAARTHRSDIIPVVEISQRAGIPIEPAPSSALHRSASSRKIGRSTSYSNSPRTLLVSP